MQWILVMLVMNGQFLKHMITLDAKSEADCKAKLIYLASQPKIRQINPLVKCMRKDSEQYKQLKAATKPAGEEEA